MSKPIKQFDNYFKELAPEIRFYIFSFILIDPKCIEFKNKEKNKMYYSKRYQTAFFKNKLLYNSKGIYLVKIEKKKGKARYFLTTEIEVCGLCNNEIFDSYRANLFEFKKKEYIICKCECQCLINEYCEYDYPDYECSLRCECIGKIIYQCNTCYPYTLYENNYIGKDINKALLELLIS